MKTKTKEVYYCDHCNKTGLSKGGMTRHETICFHNPENVRPCFGCNNFIKREVTMYYDNPMGGDIKRSLVCFYCEANSVFMYTPQSAIRGNQFDFGDELNEPMPKECDKFKVKEY